MDHSVDSRFEFDPARGRRIERFRRLNAGALFLASRLKEHIAEDGPTVFAHACRLGTEGIVSKKVDGAYLAGPCRVWIKVRNPASVAVQRERSEVWNK